MVFCIYVQKKDLCVTFPVYGHNFGLSVFFLLSSFLFLSPLPISPKISSKLIPLPLLPSTGTISWNGMVSLNLILSLQNPFVYTAGYEKLYHIYVWSLSFFMTVLMAFSGLACDDGCACRWWGFRGHGDFRSELHFYLCTIAFIAGYEKFYQKYVILLF